MATELERRTVTEPVDLERFQAEAVRWLIDEGQVDLALGLARSQLIRIEDRELTVDEWIQRTVQLETSQDYLERLRDAAEYLRDDNGSADRPGLLQEAFENISLRPRSEERKDGTSYRARCCDGRREARVPQTALDELKGNPDHRSAS